MIDISEELTKDFYKNKSFKKGSILIFDFEGSRTEFKIIRLNRAKKICIVEETKLYTEEDLKKLTKKQEKKLREVGNV